MAKIQAPPNIAAITDQDEFFAASAQIHKDTIDQINGRLEFDKNLNTQTVTVKFSTANTDTAVSHSLNKTSVNYMTGKKSVACTVFDGSRAPSKNTIYLRCDQVATVTLILY